MKRDVIDFGTITEDWKQGKVLLSVTRGTIVEVWKYIGGGDVPTITYAYRFYETQNTMYIPLVF